MSEKLKQAQAALRAWDKKNAVNPAPVYRVIAGGVDIEFTRKFRDAEVAFNDTGRKDKMIIKIVAGVAKRIK